MKGKLQEHHYSLNNFGGGWAGMIKSLAGKSPGEQGQGSGRVSTAFSKHLLDLLLTWILIL